jgi:hypothetical protein
MCERTKSLEMGGLGKKWGLLSHMFHYSIHKVSFYMFLGVYTACERSFAKEGHLGKSQRGEKGEDGLCPSVIGDSGGF